MNSLNLKKIAKTTSLVIFAIGAFYAEANAKKMCHCIDGTRTMRCIAVKTVAQCTAHCNAHGWRFGGVRIEK